MPLPFCQNALLLFTLCFSHFLSVFHPTRSEFFTSCLRVVLNCGSVGVNCGSDEDAPAMTGLPALSGLHEVSQAKFVDFLLEGS